MASASAPDDGMNIDSGDNSTIHTRAYQQEMLEASLHTNIICCISTGAGKTHIAVLRLKDEIDRERKKVSWFLAPTVALCEQQREVIKAALPVPVGLISGVQEPNQWRNASLWSRVLETNRIIVSTPQVLLDALRHAYVSLGKDISLMVFDEAHHAVDNHPYNRIMVEFYFPLPDAKHRIDPGNIAVRPKVLGLTASPIYGGNVDKAFRGIEKNLDCTIRAPRHSREELAQYVHRPEFRHAMFASPATPPFSTNLASLRFVQEKLNIEEDPYVISLRQQLAKEQKPSQQWHRLDQKLSKVIRNQDSFSHKGMRDFVRTAEDILSELGTWCADWYVWAVLQKAREVIEPENTMMRSWKNSEKRYLKGILARVIASPISYHPDDIADESSDKLRVLIEVLLHEKEETEQRNESYSGLIFVTRRDVVMALCEILISHPVTRDVFQVGSLLGSSDTTHRHSFLDITTRLGRDNQKSTLQDFKTGEKNLLISTSVAEEGIDVQACGSVIRWDPPQNIVSWTQSRGRARKQKSTFTMLLPDDGAQRQQIDKWLQAEKEMTDKYVDPSRELFKDFDEDPDNDDEYEEFRVESTGALVSTQSAIPHLAHFCAVMPNLGHLDFRPTYDLEPPEMPEGWHSFADQSSRTLFPYTGPWGCTVTLPKLLKEAIRVYTAPCIYRTKVAAYRHAAYIAYLALYEAKLLDDNLLPLSYRGEDVEEIMKEIGKRSSTESVSLQMNPWAPIAQGSGPSWYISEIVVEGLPSVYLLTQSEPAPWEPGHEPILYVPRREAVKTTLRRLDDIDLTEDQLEEAREYTRRVFWSIHGARMDWDQTDFSYLLLPSPELSNEDQEWEERRTSLADERDETDFVPATAYSVNAAEFADEFGCVDDISMVRDGLRFGKLYQFVRWRYQDEPLSEEETEDLLKRYDHYADIELSFPLMVVQAPPPKTNFLIPSKNSEQPLAPPKLTHLLPRSSAVVMISGTEAEYSFLLPSFLRALSLQLTIHDFRRNVLASSPQLSSIPTNLLTTAMTAPLSQEKYNYQRLETMGDTVLKFVMSVQLLAEYPLWHEGYLTRKKDHSVSNVRLAKSNLEKRMYRWIIRDRLVGKKWKPLLQTNLESEPAVLSETDEMVVDTGERKKKKKKKQNLSTKVLADVVESTIGAAYLHGGVHLGYVACAFFELGLKNWHPLSHRYGQVLSQLDAAQDLPLAVVQNVESMLGYTFKHKILLVEALTHASCETNHGTVSYERLEFLGDSVLDMVVTDYLYRAPGKNYSPGHIHLRRSALVNAHTLAYFCLRCSVTIQSSMAHPDDEGSIVLESEDNDIYLWKCLLHSSSRVMEDQATTFARFQKQKNSVEEAMTSGGIFPWAALVRLQAPKFFSDMIESLIGATFLDSEGSMDAAKGVMRRLGILQLMERIVKDDVDVLHPVSRLSMWATNADKKLEYKFPREKGNITCIVTAGGDELASETDVYRGRATQEEVKFTAAETAVRSLRLRTGRKEDLDFVKKRKRKAKSTTAKSES